MGQALSDRNPLVVSFLDMTFSQGEATHPADCGIAGSNVRWVDPNNGLDFGGRSIRVEAGA